MDSSVVISKTDKFIWILTAVLYACFSIMNTDPIWSSLSLLLITGLVAIITAMKYGTKKLRVTSYQFDVLFFAAYFFLSALWSINPSDAIERGITVVELCLCMSVFMWAFSNIQNSFLYLLKAVMYGGFIVTIYTFYFVGINDIMYMVAAGNRMDSSFDNVNAIGLICAISLILSVFFLYKKKSWLIIILDILTIILLSACGSRKAMLVTILGCFAIYLFHKQSQNKVAFIFKMILSLTLLYVIVHLLSEMTIFAGITGRMEGLIALVTGNGEVDHSAQVRQDMVNLGISIFKENPILGIGMGSAHIYTLKYIGHDCYLHNNYAEILADGGIIGTIMYYRIHVNIIKKLRNSSRMTTQEGILILILMFCLLVSDLSMVSFYSKLYYFFFMAFYIYINKKNEGKNIIYCSRRSE